MVETEPEFDADERESWDALEEYRTVTCPHCGNLRVVCSNPLGASGRGFWPQLDHCWVTAARDVTVRRFRDKHKDAKPDGNGYLPTDGALLWASTTNDTPGDNFL